MQNRTVLPVSIINLYCNDYECDAYSMSLTISEYNSTSFIYQDTGIQLAGLTGMLFEVKGTNELYLGLSQVAISYLTTDMYEVSMETNVLQLKRGEQGQVMDEYTGSVHNITTYTPFWTTWANGDIQVGRGFTIGENILVKAVDTTYDVNFIIVATTSGETSYWRFYVNGRKPLGKFGAKWLYVV